MERQLRRLQCNRRRPYRFNRTDVPGSCRADDQRGRQFQSTAARQLIAGEIAAANPDLVGLQEAAHWTVSGALPIDIYLQNPGPEKLP